jgi:acetyl-CoA synthetase
MKVAGHRLSTAEVENAIAGHELVAECAVVAAPHEIKGETPWAFVRLKSGEGSDEITKALMGEVVKALGPTCRPDKIIFTDAVPRTRSGKIMRRILKSLVKNEPIGDVTTIENPECVEELKKEVGYKG